MKVRPRRTRDQNRLKLRSSRKREPDPIFASNALCPNLPAMRLDQLFHDGESNSCTAMLARTRFIDPIKALENERKILAGNGFADVNV